jgi:hypothetical protein
MFDSNFLLFMESEIFESRCYLAAMMKTTTLFLVGASLLSACGIDADELPDTATVDEAITGTIAVSVPVGDPINMVSAPAVTVTAAVGDTVSLTAATTCTTCNSWYDPDHGIPRFGGVLLGSAPTLSIVESVAGNSRVNLRYCVRTSPRFSRCINTNVFITTN